MSNDKILCANCVYFQVSKGECHRCPPGVIATNATYKIHHTCWPNMDPADWCGEGKAKEPQDAA
jgi:hypothetical protein